MKIRNHWLDYINHLGWIWNDRRRIIHQNIPYDFINNHQWSSRAWFEDEDCHVWISWTIFCRFYQTLHDLQTLYKNFWKWQMHSFLFESCKGYNDVNEFHPLTLFSGLMMVWNLKKRTNQVSVLFYYQCNMIDLETNTVILS